MAITREHKENIVTEYSNLIDNLSGLVVTEYRGMKMDELADIRKALRDVGATYFVTKNRLLKLALKEAGLPVPDDLLSGPVAVGFTQKDLPAMIKVFLNKAKDRDKLILKGAIVGNSVFNEKDLKTLSELPTLDEIRAQLLGMLLQPAQQLLAVLGTPAQDLVSVLEAGSQTLVSVLAAYAAKNDAA